MLHLLADRLKRSLTLDIQTKITVLLNNNRYDFTGKASRIVSTESIVSLLVAKTLFTLAATPTILSLVLYSLQFSFVPNFSATSASANYFTPQHGEQNLWQLEGKNRSNCDEISSAIEIADKLPLHLLPFDHSGKINVITPLRVLVR